jgi:hypothetical protein
MSAQNPFRGRDAECAALDVLLDAARRGESRALVLRGEPGVGKTALLEHAIGSAPDFRVLRAVGIELEMELAFASLHQVCAPMLDRLDRLPGPRQDALRAAFGLSAGAAADRFLVGIAALSLLSEVAEEQPLLCAVDDAQWLDEASAQALAFVAHRLFAERMAILFVTRTPIEALSGLPELIIDGIGDDHARAVLASGIQGPLDEQVRERIIAEARGNPLALLELPRGLTPAELAGGFALPDARPLANSIERSFLRRVRSLPPHSQRLLLLAATEPVGDVLLLWRAARQLGVAPDAVAPAEAAGLLELGGRVRFRHPLVRSAIYRAATPDDRREVHRALAEATDPETDPDRRAWHRAQSTAGLDEAVASELERSAERARRRGGVAAMAAFLERAAEVTPDPAHRGARALAAAQAKLDAGAPEAAQRLLATAELTPLDEFRRAPRGFGARSCSPGAAAATLHPCSWAPRSGSNRSTLRQPVRRTSRRSEQRSSPAGRAGPGEFSKRPKPFALRPPRRSRRGRSTSSWTVSPSASPSGSGRRCRRSRERCMHTPERTATAATRFGGFGSHARLRRSPSHLSCGMTRCGMSWPVAR